MLKREWDNIDLYDKIARERMNIFIHMVEELRTYRAGSYLVTPFASQHDISDGSLLYAVRRERSLDFLRYRYCDLSRKHMAWVAFKENEI